MADRDEVFFPVILRAAKPVMLREVAARSSQDPSELAPVKVDSNVMSISSPIPVTNDLG
jgi:hypothetical protein